MKFQLFSLLLSLSTHYAAPLIGSAAGLISGQMEVAVEIDEKMVLTMRGPDNTWFGVGFGNKIMDGAYSIIATSDSEGNLTVEEWTLGPHQRGSLIAPQSLQVTSDAIDGVFRTVTVERPILGTTYDFPIESGDIDIIVSDGLDGVIEYALARGMGEFENTTLSFVSEPGSLSGEPTLEPTLQPTSEPTLEPTIPNDATTAAPTDRARPVRPTATETTVAPQPEPEPEPESTLPPNVYLYASAALSNEQSVSFYMEQLVKAQLVIVMTGPSDAYFGVGFGNDQMDGTYAFIVDNNGGVSERILEPNAPGTLLQPTATVLINEVNESGIRTVAVLRFANVDSVGYYNFDDFINCESEMPLIYSSGEELLDLYVSQWGNEATVSGDCTTIPPSEDTEPSSIGSHIIPSVSIIVMSMCYAIFA